jgi:hypothetical protein
MDSISRYTNNNNDFCFWCHCDDEVERTKLICDLCNQKVFCDSCVKRNFGKKYYNIIVKTDPWFCFVCDPTPLAHLQQVASEPLLNMEKVFSSIASPTELHSHNSFRATAAEIHAGYCPETENLRISLLNSPGALKLASIFCKYIDQSVFPDLILPFLTSRDLAVARAVSKDILRLLNIMTLTPGLFSTEYGIENKCKLFPHQMLDLSKMKELENRAKDFGSLRGGIFADSPGLIRTL